MHSVCKDKIEDMNLLADGMLGAKEAAEIKEHLLACPSCDAHYKEIAAMKRALSSMSLEAPSDLDSLIKNAVRSSTRKAIVRRNIYRYSTMAAASLVVIIFLFSRGLFNMGSDKNMEMAELQDSGNIVTDGMRSDDSNYALIAENADSIEEAAGKGEDSPSEALVPQPEVGEALDMYGGLTDYRYTTSAIEDTESVVVNPDGMPLDSGFTGMQDIFYASGAFTIDEMMAVLSDDFKTEGLINETDTLFFYINAKDLKKLESRFGLVASEVLAKNRDMVSVRIISVKDND